MTTHQLPIVDSCDLLILGGTGAAVGIALAAHAAGRRVLVAAPRPYLGEDIAMPLRFSPPGPHADPLAAEIFCDRGRAPSPLHAKRTLEQALVTAGIPFLLTVQPAGLLYDAAGRIAGAVIADRNGLQAVAAQGVVDASERGLLGDAAGCARAPWQTRVQVRRTLCCSEAPVVAGADVDRWGTMPITGPDQVVRETPVWSASWSVTVADSSAPVLAALDQATALACWHPRQVLASELVEVAWPDRFTGLEADGRAGPAALWIVGPCVATFWREPSQGLAAGRSLGTRIAGILSAPGVPVRVAWPAPAGQRTGAVRIPDEGLRAGAVAQGVVAIDVDAIPALDVVDVAVCGGGTAGAPAGIAAARAGARTAVFELLCGLGGVGTLGQICGYYYGNRVGFTAEIDRGWPKVGPGCQDILDLCTRNDQWNPDWRCRWYLAELAKAGGTAWFGFATVGAVVAGDRVAGAVVVGPWGFGSIAAQACVDASGSSDLAAAAGAATETIGAEHLAVQGTGLGPKDPFRYHRNTDHTFVDDNDLADTTRALVSAKTKFAGAFDLGQLVDSRERRRIRGEVCVQPGDLLCRRSWRDTVVQSCSNFDSHGFTVHPIFLAKPMHTRVLWADVPLRALLPQGLEGVLVTGLAISAHRDALPVIRMQADVQNQGYAAGRAAAMARSTGGRLRAIDLQALQQHLVEVGNLDERVLIDVDANAPDAREVAWAVEHGLDLHMGLALIFERPDLAAPLLRQALATASDARRRERVALILGLLGDPAATETLAGLIAASPWDEGWNFRGMSQFGSSTSRVDALIIALGTGGDARALPVLATKIAALDATASFSHCRAVAEAMRLLRGRGIDLRPLAPALAALLALPGMSGHAETDVIATQRSQTKDGNETQGRNRSLRDIVLAAGLLRSGDHQGRGAAILRAYADDLRGHYRRHALAVLAECGVA